MGDTCDDRQTGPCLDEDYGLTQPAAGSDTQAGHRVPHAPASPPSPQLDPAALGGDLSPSSSSSMTTKELQEYWQGVKSREKPVKLLFEIPSARIVEQPLCRYVMYQIVVIKSGSYDAKQVTIERRYSDFERLQQTLLRDFSEELEEVSFPRKRLTSNFAQESIDERRVAFRDYLARLYALRCVRRSPAFLAFFTEPELRQAHVCLRGGKYARALELLLPALNLQEKLAQHCPALLVPALCAALVCHRDLEDSASAFAMGERALALVRRLRKHKYRCPLLAMLIDLGYELGRPIAQLQEELTQARDAQRGPVSQLSLKELVVQEFA
ncbi:SNX20 protein, partial [Atractosteus spatula]|nr:SNX20 protein [Atractosteus spatula]